PGAERALGSVLIVRPAAQPDPRHAGPASARHLLDVIELEQLARRTAAPRLAHEGALPAVPLPHRPLDGSGDVTRVSARPPAPARPRGRRELALLEPLDQGVERA